MKDNPFPPFSHSDIMYLFKIIYKIHELLYLACVRFKIYELWQSLGEIKQYTMIIVQSKVII